MDGVFVVFKKNSDNRCKKKINIKKKKKRIKGKCVYIF